MSSKTFKLLSISLVMAIIMVGAQMVTAQETRGTIRGIVTDPNGQAVPNATVVLTDTATGNSVKLLGPVLGSLSV